MKEPVATARPRPCLRAGACALVTATLVAVAPPARAADTVETWDVGASNVDFYLGFEELDDGGGSAFADILLGYGVLDGFSVYLGATLLSDEHLDGGSHLICVGFFGTLFDSTHVDVDGFLQVVSGGGEFRVVPAVELNLDADPGMRTWGLYLRTHLPIYGQHLERPGLPDAMEVDTTYHLAVTAGAYRRVARRHQLLIETSVDFHPAAAPGERRGTAVMAAGYNVQLTDSLELITQLLVQPGEDASSTGYGAMAGFIATLPASRP